MGVFRSMSGTVCLELISADIPGLLIAITELEIPVFNVRIKGEVTLCLQVRRTDHRALTRLCRKRGESIRIVEKRGIYWAAKAFLNRPLLIMGLAVMVWGAIWLPSRVFFFRVDGNVSIPDNQVLEAAWESGIRFGASRREVRSERVKNALLEQLPQLQWAGVNTSGCVATISVRERSLQGEESTATEGICSIVADCDGIILSATVTRGAGLCSPGQAVTEGQLLISGYQDLGLTIQATRAEGEVFAATRRKICLITPSVSQQKGEILGSDVYYSILIGKNRINLWKDSGISAGSCDRMYEEYYVTLPGGFLLPIALIKETVSVRDTAAKAVEPSYAEELLLRYGRSYLISQMVSGQIRGEHVEFTEADGCYYLDGGYLCTEMIGRVRQEKIGE